MSQRCEHGLPFEADCVHCEPELLEEPVIAERERIRAWVFHLLGRSPDGLKVLEVLDHTRWPPGAP